MATSMPRKQRPWYSPGRWADFANDGFLTVAMGTGAAVRGVQRGGAKGLSALARPLRKPPPAALESAQKVDGARMSGAARSQASPSTPIPGRAHQPQQIGRASPPEPRPPVGGLAPSDSGSAARPAKRDIEGLPALAEPAPVARPGSAPSHAAASEVDLSSEDSTTPARQGGPPRVEPGAKPVAPATDLRLRGRDEDRAERESPAEAFLPPEGTAPAANPSAGNARTQPIETPVSGPPAAPPAPREDPGTGGIAGLFRALWGSEPSERMEAPSPSAPAAVQSGNGGQGHKPRASQPPARRLLPRQPIDVEALVANHPFPTRAQMLNALVSVNEFLNGAPRESEDAQRKLVSIAPLAEHVFLAALQRGIPRLSGLALEGLARLGAATLEPAVRELLSSTDRNLRMVALRAAQRLEDDAARPLLSMMAADPSPEVRRRLITYLSWRDSPWAMLELRGLCNDPVPAVRWPAIDVLARAQPDLARELIGRMLPTSADQCFRRRIEAAFAKRGAGARGGAGTAPPAPVTETHVRERETRQQEGAG